MQPGCAWPSSTYRRGCTGKERTSGLQACNLGVNGRKNVLCVHPRKVSEVRFERQLRIIFTYCVMLQHQVQIAITTLEDHLPIRVLHRISQRRSIQGRLGFRRG